MIGIFDSGIGGLGVLIHVRRLLPAADIVYVADHARAPYGTRSLKEVADISADISGRLIEKGAQTVVIACNTASAAALHSLRAEFPNTSFVGMETAVKPATMETRTGVIGVLATAATFQSELYESVVQRFGGDATIRTAACPDWVEMVESGIIDGPAVEHTVRAKIEPILEEGADTLVLGCTHFPFLLSSIEAVAGPNVTIVDPAPAVGRQVARLDPGSGSGELSLMSTGDPGRFEELVRKLGGLELSLSALAFGD